MSYINSSEMQPLHTNTDAETTAVVLFGVIC